MGCGKCPRCLEHCLEWFQSHNYCANCNYSSTIQAKVLSNKNKKISLVDPELVTAWLALNTHAKKI